MKPRAHKKQVNRYKRVNLLRDKRSNGSHKRCMSQAKFDRFVNSVPKDMLGSRTHMGILHFQEVYKINIRVVQYVRT